MAKTSDKQKAEAITLICNRLSQGESLRKVCKDKDLPCRDAFYRWIDANKEFEDQYARAIKDRADNIFEDILEIADDSTGDYHRDRLRVDSRKWMLGKMNPKKYGDKNTTDLNVNIEQPLFPDDGNS